MRQIYVSNLYPHLHVIMQETSVSDTAPFYKRRERCLPLGFLSEGRFYRAAEAYGKGQRGWGGPGPVTLARTTTLDKPIDFASTGGYVHPRHPAALFILSP